MTVYQNNDNNDNNKTNKKETKKKKIISVSQAFER